MKKILSVFLAMLLLISGLTMLVSAEGEQSEITNIAPKGLAYCTSMKHSIWTPPNSINDGVPNDWHGWEPEYPKIEPGQDTSAGFSGEYCGIKFLNREYYEISEIHMHLGLHAQYKQNVTYKIQALVEGEWQDVVTFTDSECTLSDYSSYEEFLENDKTNYHSRATYNYTLPAPITTNNVRITVSNFAKNFPGGDVLIFPYIYEVELMGKLGITPEIDLPEGAEVSTNAAYNAISQATSSKYLSYPFLAIDGKEDTAWVPGSLEAGQTLSLELEKAYSIEKLVLNFGKVRLGATPVNHKFVIEAFIDGQWQKLFDGNSYNEASGSYITEYPLSAPIITNQIRIVFEQLASAPEVYELEAHITGEKTYYNPTKYSAPQKNSAAKGNLAILGTAYASLNKAPYSEPSFINDGRVSEGSKVWFPGVLDIPVSCGIKLNKTYTVNKVVVYCQDPTEIGADITSYNVVATVNGVSTIIASGASYDATKIIDGVKSKYVSVYDFPSGIVTDDIKIEFTRGNSTIPNVLELEIYSDTAKPTDFDGYYTTDTPPVITGTITPDPDPEKDSKAGLIIGIVAVTLSVAIVVFVLLTAKKKTTNMEDKEEPSEEKAKEAEGEAEAEPKNEE